MRQVELHDVDVKSMCQRPGCIRLAQSVERDDDRRTEAGNAANVSLIHLSLRRFILPPLAFDPSTVLALRLPAPSRAAFHGQGLPLHARNEDHLLIKTSFEILIILFPTFQYVRTVKVASLDSLDSSHQ
jgi:hypothetical protein